MTHREEVKEMLIWSQKDEWYGFDADRGFFLKKDAPPEAVESFKKWAAYQDKLNGEGYSYSLDIA